MKFACASLLLMAVISRASTKPKKIAILGGGIPSLTTALYLTGQPGWQERYGVTIYQVGWRLGGKGASGRNKKYGQRVEEYGIHLWYGLYYNAFRMMREVYEELDRPKEIPIRTFEDAFKPLILMKFDLPLQGGEPIKNCFRGCRQQISRIYTPADTSHWEADRIQ